MRQLTERLGGFAYGGDYNPDQWPEHVWPEDVRLMREAGVTLVTVGVFAWARLQPAPDRWEPDWLDRILDLLVDGGIAVDLATATASPPPWFTTANPDAALVDAAGVRRVHGARQAYCPSSPAFRHAARELVTRLAERYADHPAVAMWHVSNEYACHNWHCFCDVSAAAFRDWLRQRYDGLAELNDAWGTSFWSQGYSAWEQILPPRAVAYDSFANPTQQLDWWRFSSDEHQRLYLNESEVLHAVATQPVTTNFMSFFKPLDYWRFADHVDLVSNDDYLIGADPDPAERTAMSADLVRSLAGGAPWLLMEHSTSAVNWQPHNLAKAPGRLRLTSLQHLARGSDGALFFQWRAARAGAEKFHSALVPHAGIDSRVWREVVDFGAELRTLAPVAGSTVEPARVAIVHDWPAWWAAELDSHPSRDVTPMTALRRWYGVLRDRQIGVDFVRPGAPLGGYDLVVLPGQYLVEDDAAQLLADRVDAGAVAVVTYFSGIVDEHDHVRLGGYPGAFRELLGVRIEEFAPLLPDSTVGLDDGSRATVWAEYGRTTTAEVLASYADGPTAGCPAVTVNGWGSGLAYYVGTELADDSFATLVDRVLGDGAVGPVVAGLPRGVEAVRRVRDGRRWVFVINPTARDAVVPELGRDVLGRLRGGVLAAGDATVIEES